MKRTIDDTIEEMKSIKDYFEKETDGSCPMCILESIEILTALKTLKESL